jgi:hypothetical protein
MSQGILDGVWTGLAKGVAACERARDKIRVQMAPDPVTGQVRQSTMRLLADGFLSNLIVLLRIGQGSSGQSSSSYGLCASPLLSCLSATTRGSGRLHGRQCAPAGR